MNLRFLLGLLAVCDVHAATNYVNSAPPIASQYGLVQNVQNYSTNPFWDPNGPYNQRIAPTVVYVQGADVNTGDCQRTVASLIATHCMANNNCLGMTLSDVRPTIMLQLSRLPGHNFASACAGYIDSEFNTYATQNRVAAPTGYGAAFPNATAPNPAAGGGYKLELENPYEEKKAIWNNKPWAQEKKDRENELKRLQAQNGAGQERLVAAAFPTTAADLSFAERMNNKAAGYEQYKDSSAYAQITIESEEDEKERRDTLNGLLSGNNNGGTGAASGTTPSANTPVVNPALLGCEDLKNLIVQLDSDYNTVTTCATNNTPDCGTDGRYKTSIKNPFTNTSGGTNIVFGGNNYNTSLPNGKDVQVDPITGERLGCNTMALWDWTRTGHPIHKQGGDHMFCAVKTANGNGVWAPRMRTCIVGSNDHWSEDCSAEVWCNASRPDADALNVKFVPNMNQYCWDWHYMNTSGGRVNNKVTWKNLYEPLIKEIAETMKKAQEQYSKKCQSTKK